LIYLDASALVSLFMPDRHTTVVRDFLRAERPIVGVSDFASAEFCSTVARRVRMADLTLTQAGHLLGVFDGWTAANAAPLDVEPSDVRVASTFVRRFELGLRAPDALHVAICHRLELPLCTFDERQAAAAERLGVRRGPPRPAEA
jgi:predicted nucleic acid-binding protein